MESLPDLLLFVAIVAGVLVVAVRIGMLVAPRLDRLTNPHDEDDRAEPD